MCSFRQSRRFFDALCLCAFHSPQPRIFSPVESTIKSIGPSWDRVRGGTATIWFRRESVVWSGALRLRPIKRSSESRNPSVWRSGRLKTTRSVNAVRTARFEYRRWPPRRPFFGGTHAAIASSLSQIVTSPRLLRPRSYSLQFRILYFFLYWRLTRLDFAATTTLPPPISMMDWTPPPPLACSLTPIHAPTPLQTTNCGSDRAGLKTLTLGCVADAWLAQRPPWPESSLRATGRRTPRNRTFPAVHGRSRRGPESAGPARPDGHGGAAALALAARDRAVATTPRGRAVSQRLGVDAMTRPVVCIALVVATLTACVQTQDEHSPAAQALADLRASAEAGDAEAQFILGGMYATGVGVPQDAAEAVAWYRRAAEQGDARAQSNLGAMYAGGVGVPQDAAEAVAWYRRAAEQGDASAQSNLGAMYDQGRGVPQDAAEAVAWYRRGADEADLAPLVLLRLDLPRPLAVLEYVRRAHCRQGVSEAFKDRATASRIASPRDRLVSETQATKPQGG